MARKVTEEQPAVRKSLLVICGVAIGAALIGFVLVNFVLAGHGGGAAPSTASSTATSTLPQSNTPLSTTTPAPASNEETPGGRDPFSGPIGIAPLSAPAPSAAPAAQAAAPAPKASVLAAEQVNPHFSLNVVKVSGSAVDLKFDGKSISGAHAGDKLPDGVIVNRVGDGCASFDQGGKVFSVCQGQTVQR